MALAAGAGQVAGAHVIPLGFGGGPVVVEQVPLETGDGVLDGFAADGVEAELPGQ